MVRGKGRDREQARAQVDEIRFEPDAIVELHEAAAWYEARRPGLGTRFLGAIGHALVAVANHPSAFRRIVTARPNREVRRIMLRRFPVALIYFAEGNEIRIVAVAHARRIPNYWLLRIVEGPSDREH